MRSSLGAALNALLSARAEGGYQNNPNDTGNYFDGVLVGTNLGVTPAAWADWTKQAVTVDTMRGLTIELVTPFYKAKYWDAVRGDDLPVGVDVIVFDTAVNSGAVQAAKLLQRVLALTEDGVIGPNTLGAAQKVFPGVLVNDYVSARHAFLKELKNFDVFGIGWYRRVAFMQANALLLV